MSGREDRGPAAPGVRGGRGDCGAKVGFARHIVDRVVGQYDVERPPQSEGAHVAGAVFALGVQFGAELEHLGGEVGERAGEAPLQVRCGVAAAGAKLEQRLGRAATNRLGKPNHVVGLRLVLIGMGDVMKPRGEFAVHAHGAYRSPARGILSQLWTEPRRKKWH